MDQLHLFDPPAPPRPRSRAAPSGAGRVIWTKLVAPKGKRLPQCDHCLLDAHEANGPIPMRARTVRTQDGIKRYLCFGHANDQRARERLKPF